MKRYFCDRCGKHIDIDHDGFARMRVDWWSRGENAERMEYRPDFRHREGTEEHMLCAACANETFGHLAGMEEADATAARQVDAGTCHDTHEDRWFRCSACGFGIEDMYLTDEDEYPPADLPKYCPNCGRRCVW